MHGAAGSEGRGSSWLSMQPEPVCEPVSPPKTEPQCPPGTHCHGCKGWAPGLFRFVNQSENLKEAGMQMLF